MPANTIDTGDYRIGGAALYFSASVGDVRLESTAFEIDELSFGNVVTSEIAPEYTQVDHWVSSNGKRIKDKTVLNTSALSINFTWDEMNQNNLTKFFVGTQTASKISVLQNTLDEGSAVLVINTAIGEDMTYSIPKCIIRPDGAMSLNTEDWHSAAMVLDVLEYITGDSAFSNATWVSNPFGLVDTSAL